MMAQRGELPAAGDIELADGFPVTFWVLGVGHRDHAT